MLRNTMKDYRNKFLMTGCEFTLAFINNLGQGISLQQISTSRELLQTQLPNKISEGIYTLSIRTKNKFTQKKIVVCK